MGLDLARIKELAAEASDQRAVVLPMDPGTVLHVDGDYAAYYFAGKDETLLSAAKANMLSALRAVEQIAGAGGGVVIHITSGLSDKGGRFKIATVKPYQGQRDPGRKPKNWEGLRLWLESAKTLPGTNYRVVTWTDREADDGISAAARYAWQGGNIPAILMRDKDSRMIPARHIDWTTYERYEVRPETWKLDTGQEDTNGPVIYGQIAFWYQLLQGDTADNIPGLEKQQNATGSFVGCGKACAHSALDNAKTAEEAFRIVRNMYNAYYGASWPDRFVEQAALLWLRTDNKAYVGDFMRAIPFRSQELEQALLRMEKRIR